MTDQNSPQHRIDEGMEVTLHFTLKLEDGTVVDSTRDKAPATFQVGDGNLPPGFEHPMKGMSAGESATFEITPDNLLRSLAGEDGGPQGTLPLTVPRSAQAIADSPRVVPGKFCGEDYVYLDRDGVAYSYGHGLRY